MRELGRIVRLQIQRSTLKTGDKPARVYSPAPLLAVARLAVGPDGVLGESPDGSWLLDVHHRAHPHTKNEDGAHGISLGFTAKAETHARELRCSHAEFRHGRIEEPPA